MDIRSLLSNSRARDASTGTNIGERIISPLATLEHEANAGNQGSHHTVHAWLWFDSLTHTRCTCLPGSNAILCAADPFLTHEEVRERGRLLLTQDAGTRMLRFVREPEAAAATGRASLFIPHTAHHYEHVQ